MNPEPMHANHAQPNSNRSTLATKIGRSLGILALGILPLGILVGCSDGEPFPLEKVSGKVTYADGSLIEASMIQIMFKSTNVDSKEGKAPRGAKGMVDPKTGEFSKLTTWKPGDGVICGHNKVAIVPMEFGKGIDEMGRPDRKTIDRKYFTTGPSTLEVEVVAGGENHFELIVERPRGK